MSATRAVLVALSMALLGGASGLSAQASVQETGEPVDLSTLSRRARIDSLNDGTLTSDLRAFEERRRKAKRKGVFLGPEELDALRPRLFQDLFAGRNDAIAVNQAPNLRMRRQVVARSIKPPVSASGTITARSIASSNVAGATSPQTDAFCTPDVFVDNLWINSNRTAVSLVQLDHQWSAESVVAVEIYESPWSIPNGFPVMQGGDCGLIAFWTSRRASVNR